MNAAREKVEAEGVCRVCGHGPARVLEAAHVVDRSLVPGQDFEDPDGIVPLCTSRFGGASCHERYDAHELDLLPHLTMREQATAVARLGLYGAFRRVTGGQLPEDYAERGLFDG